MPSSPCVVEDAMQITDEQIAKIAGFENFMYVLLQVLTANI
jgi:hypothetical protein